MGDFASAIVTAVGLILSLDQDLTQIVALSLEVSLTAVVLASLIGLPLGGAIALVPFPGRGAVATVMNAMMGLPPVVVGLLLYLLLSRSGPLGAAGSNFR